MSTTVRQALLTTIAIIIILLGSFVRFSGLERHFSHIDDAVVPYYILKSPQERLTRIEKQLGHELTPGQRAAYFKYQKLLHPLGSGLFISDATTYAPLQFVLTDMLLYREQQPDYKQVLLLSRLPSFLFAVLSLGLIAMLFRKIFGSSWLLLLPVGLSVLSFSWLHSVYSMQAENYTIGVFAALCLLLLLFKYAAKPQLSIKESILLGVCQSLLMLCQYQLIFLTAAFYLAVLFQHRRDFKRFFRSYALSAFTCMVTFAVLFKMFLSRFSNNGVNWNAGPQNEYLFQLKSEPVWYDKIWYVIHFFFVNTYVTFKSLISFAPEQSIINDVAAVAGILLLVSGVRWFLSSAKARVLAVYFFSVCLVWLLLICSQKITLSPTRHSLILIVFLIIFIPAGIYYLYERFFAGKTVLLVGSVLALTGLVSILFFFTYSEVMEKRTDPFREADLSEVIKTYDVSDICTYGFTYNPFFMNSITGSFSDTVGRTGEEMTLYDLNNQEKKEWNVMFISHRPTFESDTILSHYLSALPATTNHRLLFKKERKSNTDVCFGNYTNNGTNGLYVYVYRFARLLQVPETDQ